MPKVDSFVTGFAVLAVIASICDVWNVRAFSTPCAIQKTRAIVPENVWQLQATKAQSVDLVSYKPSMKLQDEEFDTIVIGSGIGGLATAAILAQSQENHKVLVLEQHYKLGGCCHTFTKRGYKFGTGIHYVGEVGEDDAESATGMRLRELLNAVTPKNDSIQWTRMQANYDTIVIGRGTKDDRRYKIYANEHQSRLKEQFPNDRDCEAIDQYFALCDKVKMSFNRAMVFKMLPRPLVKALRWTGMINLLDKGYHKYASVTLREVVDSLPTDNQYLKAALMYNWGDYGSPPEQTPFLMHSLLVLHYQKGAYYPTGSSDAIPKKVIPVITSHGGKVLANAPVRRILMDKGRAAGVELMDGTKIAAKRSVVSDAGVVNTCRYLVPPNKRKAMMKRMTVPDYSKAKKKTEKETSKKRNKETSHAYLENGQTGLCLFVGLKGDHDKDLNLPHSHLWLYPSPNIDEDTKRYPTTLQDGLKKLKPQDLTPLFVGSPSGKDDAWKKQFPDKSTLEIITSVPWSWFEKFAPNDKKQAADEHDAAGAVDLGGKSQSRQDNQEYQQAKTELAEMMYARARQGLVDSGATPENLPATLEGVATYELGTPLSYAHYLWNDKGAFYGLDHGMHRFSPRMFFQELRPVVKEVPGLYLAGEDITVSSLAGALCGAYLCASKILGKLDPFSLLQEVENNRVVGNSCVSASKEEEEASLVPQ